jgi:hypothetical protein
MVNYSWYHRFLESKYFILIFPKFHYRLSIFYKLHLFFNFSFISTTSFFGCFVSFCFVLFGVLVCLVVCGVLVLNHSPSACWALAQPQSYRLKYSSITVFAARLSPLAKSFCLVPIFANIKDYHWQTRRQYNCTLHCVCKLVTDAPRHITNSYWKKLYDLCTIRMCACYSYKDWRTGKLHIYLFVY